MAQPEIAALLDHGEEAGCLELSEINQLAEKGKLRHWRDAYESGQIKVAGDSEIRKLIGTVIERHMARTRLKKAH